MERWRGFAITGGIYVLFAVAAFLAHGPTPALNIDHIQYFKLTDEILRSNPDGHYLHEVSATRSYGVLLAYLYHLTGDHVASLKLLLAAMTLLYLAAFDLFWSLFTLDRWRRVLFALLSALHVSFGAMFWGVTDFSASLNRTAIVPVMLVLLWLLWHRRSGVLRLFVLPLLVYASLVHLSSFYLVAVLGLMETLRAGWRMWQDGRIDRESAALAVSLALCVGAFFHLQGMEMTGVTGTNTTYITPKWGDQPDRLPSAEAWRIERFAQPWRNFPPPPATLMNAASSIGFIVALAAIGLAIRWRRGLGEWDRWMLLFGGCTILAATGPQFTLWVAQKFLPVHPINLEEFRAIVFLIIPILYFVSRLFDALWDGADGLGRSRTLAVAVLVVYVLQPVYLVRALPAAAREALFQRAVESRLLDRWASQRNAYARQVLGLESPRNRFYYSTRGVSDWLAKRTTATDRILTNRDELYMLDARVLGTSNGFLGLPPDSPERAVWVKSVERLTEALADRDLVAIRALACDVGAKYVVLPWPVAGSAYSDDHFSVLRIDPCPPFTTG